MTQQLEEATLRSWNFLDDYKRHRTSLLALARATFVAMQNAVGKSPDPSDLEEALVAVLDNDLTWLGVLYSKMHSPPLATSVFTRYMARYILYKERIP